MGQLWTVKELADFLGCSRDAIYMKVYRGELPTIKMTAIGPKGGKNGNLRFDSDEIKELVNNSRIKDQETMKTRTQSPRIIRGAREYSVSRNQCGNCRVQPLRAAYDADTYSKMKNSSWLHFTKIYKVQDENEAVDRFEADLNRGALFYHDTKMILKNGRITAEFSTNESAEESKPIVKKPQHKTEAGIVLTNYQKQIIKAALDDYIKNVNAQRLFNEFTDDPIGRNYQIARATVEAYELSKMFTVPDTGVFDGNE